MKSRMSTVIYSEPSGNPTAGGLLGIAILCVSVYLYFRIVHGFAAPTMLILGGILGLSGVAESLPPDRTRVAGSLHITAIVLACVSLAGTILAPETVLP